MDKKCIIFGGGDYCLNNKIVKEKDDFVICADSGYLHAKKTNIDVDLIVGDFDSLDILMIDQDISIIKTSSIKDETDMYLAIQEAIKRGYQNIDIYGALGGRIEHSLANITLLKYFVSYSITLIDGNLRIFVLKDKDIYKIDSQCFGYVSIFSLTPTSNILIQGLKYELDNKDIYANYPLGIDNEAIGLDAIVKVNEGIILVISRFEDKNML